MRLASGFALGVISVCVIVAALLVRSDASFEQAMEDYAAPSDRFLNMSDGNQAHYRDQGNPDGPVVLMLHGEGSSLHEWEAWVPLLEDRYRLISLDLPGHGLTGRTTYGLYDRLNVTNFVLRFARDLGISSYTLVGRDFGGEIAWTLARYRPQLVDELVLIAPTGLGLGVDQDSILGRAARDPLLQPIARWVGPRWMTAGRLREQVADDTLLTPDLIDRQWTLARLPGNRQAAIARHQLPRYRDLADLDAGIEVPTLLIWGAEDEVARYDPFRLEWILRSHFSGGPDENPVAVLEDTGHMPQLEQPHQTAAIFDLFMRREGADSPLAAESRNP